MPSRETEEVEELIRHLKAQYEGSYGCFEVRALPDGSVAILHDLLTTRSIILGADFYGWSRRFCFKDRELASERFAQLESEHDIPPGYVARRPDFEDRADPYLNVLHNRPWNKEYER